MPVGLACERLYLMLLSYVHPMRNYVVNGEVHNCLLDENDMTVDREEFWSIRSGKQWDDGWDVKSLTVSWDEAKTKVHDASGITKPENYGWEKHKGCYYPTHEIFMKKEEECDHKVDRVFDDCCGDAETGPVTHSHCSGCGKVFTQFGM